MVLLFYWKISTLWIPLIYSMHTLLTPILTTITTNEYYNILLFRTCIPVGSVRLVDNCWPVGQAKRLDKCLKVWQFFVVLLMNGRAKLPSVGLRTIPYTWHIYSACITGLKCWSNQQSGYQLYSCFCVVYGQVGRTRSKSMSLVLNVTNSTLKTFTVPNSKPVDTPSPLVSAELEWEKW
jgi:hypothetical protein